MKAVIIGGGSWGLAVANLITYNGAETTVWEYNSQYVKEIKETGFNSHLLPGIPIDKNIFVTSDMAEAMKCQPQMIIFAVPSHCLRNVAKQLSSYTDKFGQLNAVVNLAKGIEEETMLRMSEVLSEELPNDKRAIVSTLSGPSHAEEVARKVPTTVVLAGTDDDSLAFTQNVLSNEYFRVYRSNDIIGVEFGGAVKNIIAIAAGIIDGLNLGDNTMGALLTRGLAEIRRLGVRLNADPNTFNGLSGIGDLITTAISKHSRNRYVGYQLGKGKALAEVLESMTMVAEGVRTTKSIYQLSRNLNVSMPITEQVYAILFEYKKPKEAIYELMTRELKEED